MYDNNQIPFDRVESNVEEVSSSSDETEKTLSLTTWGLATTKQYEWRVTVRWEHPGDTVRDIKIRDSAIIAPTGQRWSYNGLVEKSIDKDGDSFLGYCEAHFSKPGLPAIGPIGGGVGGQDIYPYVEFEGFADGRFVVYEIYGENSVGGPIGPINPPW